MNLKMPLAALDIGNTLGKVGIFENDQLVKVLYAKQEEEYAQLLAEAGVETLIMANVGKKKQLAEFLNTKGFEVKVFDHTVTVPLKNLYQTPTTLGADRMAAAVGASVLFPSTNALVIDIGTCITYEMVTRKGEYLGGNIVPGMQLRLDAMNHYTANLPKVAPAQEVPALVGQSTITCMQSGVFHGLVAEINGMIEAYSSQFDQLRVLTCGGDAIFFESLIKRPIFATQNLVLLGLYAILKEYV